LAKTVLSEQRASGLRLGSAKPEVIGSIAAGDELDGAFAERTCAVEEDDAVGRHNQLVTLIVPPRPSRPNFITTWRF
jgi:hypothetical protein